MHTQSYIIHIFTGKEHSMKKNLSIFIALLICSAIYGQRDFSTGNTSSNVMHSVHGTIAGSKYDDIKKGTPFYLDKWMMSTIYLADGKEVPNMNTKLDLLTNKVLYQQNNVAFEADSPIKKLVINETGSDNKTLFVHASTIGITEKSLPNEWYVVLVEGKASLYKSIQKKLEETRQYGSAVLEKSISTKETYFLYFDNSFQKIDRLSDLPKILTGKKNELLQFMEAQNLKKLSDENLIQAVHYYNTL